MEDKQIEHILSFLGDIVYAIQSLEDEMSEGGFISTGPISSSLYSDLERLREKLSNSRT